ncbi:MAG: hypothetical protein JWM96_214 [Alphaproteobacteria bacterium]|nr:hypothetical protein [Alphaproteobacteria bacterium]
MASNEIPEPDKAQNETWAFVQAAAAGTVSNLHFAQTSLTVMYHGLAATSARAEVETLAGFFVEKAAILLTLEPPQVKKMQVAPDPVPVIALDPAFNPADNPAKEALRKALYPDAPTIAALTRAALEKNVDNYKLALFRNDQAAARENLEGGLFLFAQKIDGDAAEANRQHLALALLEGKDPLEMARELENVALTTVLKSLSTSRNAKEAVHFGHLYLKKTRMLISPESTRAQKHRENSDEMHLRPGQTNQAPLYEPIENSFAKARQIGAQFNAAQHVVRDFTHYVRDGDASKRAKALARLEVFAAQIEPPKPRGLVQQMTSGLNNFLQKLSF